MFNPKFDGLFKAILELVFYDGERSARFVVRRSLQGIAGSHEDHRQFESHDQDLNQDGTREPTTSENRGYVPPQRIIRLFSGRRSKLPEYGVPPSVQDAVKDSNTEQPYEDFARFLWSELKPSGFSMNTYTQYFTALLNIEDGHLQYVSYRSHLYDSNAQIGEIS
jgi:hypothetical protein